MATDAQGHSVYVPADVTWEDEEEESTMPSERVTRAGDTVTEQDQAARQTAMDDLIDAVGWFSCRRGAEVETSDLNRDGWLQLRALCDQVIADLDAMEQEAGK